MFFILISFNDFSIIFQSSKSFKFIIWETIKYITINLVGYNAVDDAVSSRGKYTLSPKCVGPIEPEDAGSYDFEYLWFTDLVEYAKIKSIVVQYTNGTTKTISNISNIEWSDKLYETYFSSELDKLQKME